MEELSMQQTYILLMAMHVQCEQIIDSMNLNTSGGFESHMLKLREHISATSSLLEARIFGQLSQEPPGRTLIDNRPQDKPLSHS